MISSDCTVSADAVAVVSKPASASMRTCNAVPVAPPPGVIRLNAFPASWVLMIVNQSRVPRPTHCRSQTHQKLAASHTSITAIHTGWKRPSLSHAENTSTMLGAKK